MSVIDLGFADGVERGLTLDQVEIAHAGRRILGPVSVGVPPGEVVTLMGPSGCGKSSLLALICGTLDAALKGSGRVLLDGADVSDKPPEARHIGILFQDDLLFPHLSVGENLAFALPPAVRGRRERWAHRRRFAVLHPRRHRPCTPPACLHRDAPGIHGSKPRRRRRNHRGSPDARRPVSQALSHDHNRSRARERHTGHRSSAPGRPLTLLDGT